jgi:NADH-quinone oxidoreductase subunit G
MPVVTIDGRTVEVERGTNLIEAAKQVGVQIPHYCYHPRLTVVGQCRMCLVKVDGMPKLQAGCTTQVMKDGMEVIVDDPGVKEAQRGMMEFLLINHPLDCPICDQAGECGLQDYSFKHGQAFSRFAYEEKRTYPGRERIPLGPNVVLNMNRCIQCTRCIRFTEEISGTSELGFFQRGARTEIGVFPGKVLDNDLSTCVVDVCPVGALTSTKFRFAERVWYLDKKPSICTGCDAGCNITLEHRRGVIRRYKPRHNPEVNDYWMCDHGRTTFKPYLEDGKRLTVPRLNGDGEPTATNWSRALEGVGNALLAAAGDGRIAFLGGGDLSTEEAWLMARLAEAVRSPHRAVHTADGPQRVVPNLNGGVRGSETAPNRRGAELAGLTPGEGGLSGTDLVTGDGAAGCAVLIAAGDLGAAADDPESVARLRRARTLVVLGWRDSPLARAADIALPLATHAENQGTFVNSQLRLQRFERAFPPAGAALSGVDALGALLRRFDPQLADPLTPEDVFGQLAAALPQLAGLELDRLPPHGVALSGDNDAPAD